MGLPGGNAWPVIQLAPAREQRLHGSWLELSRRHRSLCSRHRSHAERLEVFLPPSENLLDMLAVIVFRKESYCGQHGLGPLVWCRGPDELSQVCGHCV